MKTPCIFIDRDGVLIDDRGYVYKVEDLRFLPGVVAALHQLKHMGYLLICVTNQSGVARGMFTLKDVENFNEHMLQQLASLNASLDGIYVCPHHTEGKIKEYAVACDCRKPLPGLIEQACEDFDIDLDKSFLVGDKDSDVECAENAGLGSIRIASGQYTSKTNADHTCKSLLEAAMWISSL